MRVVAEVWERLRSLLCRTREELEMDEELRFHLDMSTTSNIEAGLAPDEARRQAHLRFGGVERFKEEVREARGVRVLDDLAADLRIALRSWARRPGFPLVVVATLALGIGANVAIFSVIDGVLLQPLPYPEPDRLGVIHTGLPRQDSARPASSGPELLAYRDQTTAFSGVGGIWYRPAALTDDASEPEEIDMGFISQGFLRTLGVSPALGRFVGDGEDVPNGPRVIVLSHGLWQRRYGGDRDIVGRTVDMDDVPHTVVGVMPQGFRILLPPDAGVPEELAAWVPWGESYDDLRRTWRIFTVVTRLAPEADFGQARGELAALSAAFQQEFAEDYEATGLDLELHPLELSAVGHVRSELFLLLGAVGFIFLIACANIANMMLVRASSADREMVLRIALGASRLRLLRQLATESAVLSLVGAALGVALARWGVELLKLVGPSQLPRLASVTVSGRVLLVALLLGAVTAIVFGVVSALHISPGGAALRVGGRASGDTRRQGTRRMLVAAEIALSVVLLTGAGLLARSFVKLAEVDPGFETASVHTVKLSLVDSHYPYSEYPRIADFYRRLLRRLDALDAVDAAGATSQLPLDGNAYDLGPYAYDTPQGVVEWESVAANYHAVTPGFLEAMRARLLEGRHLEWTDDLDHPTVVVIDDTLARAVFNGRSAIGERLRVERFIGGDARPDWAEIVGVVEHLRHHPREDGVGQIYLSHQQSPQRTMTVAIRSPLGEAAILDVVKREVGELNPAQPVQGVRAMDAYLADATAPTRFALTLLGIFAVVAVVVTGIGLYGVISYSVGQRTQEFGVRLALGATPGHLRWAIVSEGALITAGGLALGLVASVALSGLLQNQLYELSSRDPLTFAVIALLLSAIALAAVYVPAHRASRVNPTIALRGE